MNPLQDPGKGIDLVNALLSVQHAHRALQAHARVHVFLGQGFVLPFRRLVVLHEHVVPDFQIASAGAGGGAVGAAGLLVGDDEHLRVASAGAGDPRGAPPVILLRQEEQVFFLHAAAAPQLIAFQIPGAVLIPLEHREGQLFLRQSQIFRAGQEFPAPGNHFLLEIIPQAPVPQHLKEGQVAGIPHVVNVARADALLHVRQPGSGGMGRTHQIGDQGMHARRRKQDRRIIFRNHGGGLDPVMSLGFHKGQEFFPQLSGGNFFHLAFPFPISVSISAAFQPNPLISRPERHPDIIAKALFDCNGQIRSAGCRFIRPRSQSPRPPGASASPRR